MMEAPVSTKWQQVRGRRSGLYLPVPSEDVCEDLSVLHAYLQWCGGSAQVRLPVAPWSPGKSEEFCCVLADRGASARLPRDPTKRRGAGGERRQGLKNALKAQSVLI